MRPENTPVYDEKTRVVAIPQVQGIQWKANNELVNPGQLAAIPKGKTLEIVAEVVDKDRVRIDGDSKWKFGS